MRRSTRWLNGQKKRGCEPRAGGRGSTARARGGFEDADELQREVRVALEERLAKIHADRRRAGKRGFLGARTVLAQPILETPASTEEFFRLNPRLAFRDWTRKKQACTGWLAFQFRYREALAEYRDGNHAAVFPCGTYRMRVHFGVTCSSGAGA